MLIVLLLLQALRQARNVVRVVGWAQQALGAPVPRAGGLWNYVFAQLARRSRDAAEQRERLARSLARFREASQALPDGVIYLSADHVIEWVNAAAASWFGLDAERDVGQPVTNLVRSPDFVAYLQAGGEAAREPLILHMPGQAGLCLAIQIIPFGEDQQMVLARDITQMERLDAMRRDFVANVSHELKTPLTVVGGFIETLLDAGDELSLEGRTHYLGVALEQAQRMQRLVEDLLTLSALQAGTECEDDDRVDVYALIRAVYGEAEQISAGRHELSMDLGEAAILQGSQKELHSAFSNLASNAVRYTPAGGRITLRWRVGEDGSGEFAVEDNGIGIAPEHLGRLTERFYRVDRGRSRSSGGTGLGLAIVKHVLSRHHAQLEIHSEPGQGSCFIARFSPRRLRPREQS